MTNYEKLCESVGIQAIMLCDCEFRNLYLYRISYGDDVCKYADEDTKISCSECEKGQCNIPYYPDFSAEKQIELEKLIIDNVGYLRIDHIKKIPNKIFERWQYNVFGGNFEVSSKNYVSVTRAEALAGLALQLAEAGELNKEEVRKVLE